MENLQLKNADGSTAKIQHWDDFYYRPFLFVRFFDIFIGQ
jgi:hypothetical protein